MPKREDRNFSEQEKRRVIELHNQGLSKWQIAERRGIQESSVIDILAREKKAKIKCYRKSKPQK